MKRQVLAIAVASLFSLPAFASYDNYELWGTGNEPGRPASTKSRDEVRNELIAAQASGDVIANAETGQLARQADPAGYRSVTVAGKSREEVLAELSAAQRSGDFVVNAELGLTAKELFPNQFGPAVVASN